MHTMFSTVFFFNLPPKEYIRLLNNNKGDKLKKSRRLFGCICNYNYDYDLAKITFVSATNRFLNIIGQVGNIKTYDDALVMIHNTKSTDNVMMSAELLEQKISNLEDTRDLNTVVSKFKDGCIIKINVDNEDNNVTIKDEELACFAILLDIPDYSKDDVCKIMTSNLPTDEWLGKLRIYSNFPTDLLYENFHYTHGSLYEQINNFINGKSITAVKMFYMGFIGLVEKHLEDIAKEKGIDYVVNKDFIRKTLRLEKCVLWETNDDNYMYHDEVDYIHLGPGAIPWKNEADINNITPEKIMNMIHTREYSNLLFFIRKRP